jgi:hypothetical protein
MFGAIEAGRSASIQFYHDWVKEVKKTVPPERLLEFDVRQGWAPLCQFLDLEIPQNDFPRVNDTKTLKKYNNVMLWTGRLVNYVLFPTLTAFIVRKIWQLK